MKNKLLVLVALLPVTILFMLTAFTNAAAVSVRIPVSGVRINSDAVDGVMTVDMADEEGKRVFVEVLPQGAANRGYDLELTQVEGSVEGEIELKEDGLILPVRTGLVKLTAVTHDGGHKASVIVNVVSSGVTGAVPEVRDEEGGSVAVTPSAEDGIDYETTLRAGSYTVVMNTQPTGLSPDVRFSVRGRGEESVAEGMSVHPVTGRAEAYFSGEYIVEAEMTPAAEGARRTTLLVRVESADGMTVQGSLGDAAVNVGGREATVFIESAAPPVCPSPLPNGAESVKVRRLAEGKYAADILFSGESGEVTLIFRSGGEERRVDVTYGTPSLRIWGRYASGDGYMQKTGTRIAYAVEGNLPKDTVYSFALKGQSAELVEIEEGEGYAVVDAVAEGTASLSVTAILPGGGVTEAEATLCTVRGYTTFLFGESAEDFGIGGVKAVGGLTAEGEDIVRSGSALVFMSARGVLFGGDCEDVIFTVSDPELAEVRTEDGVPTLFPKGRGRVTVRAEWVHAGAFGEDISASIVLDVVADGVNVGGSAGLYRAVNAGLPVVLTEDILLGEDMADADGGLSREALSALTSRIDTTADCAYHLALGRETPTVVCAMEFRADIFGNGKTLNAELITQSELFDGPLEFAAMEDVASVAAQDNIAFLVRTDGVVIDNVILRGCGDERLYDGDSLRLDRLNTTGTVLEVMADCRVLNSRILNGRTCVRAFGRYGVPTTADEGSSVDAEAEKIDVRLESCVVSHAREFLVRMGSNRKVRGRLQGVGTDYDRELMSPSLSADGITYSPGQENLTDEAFEEKFVLTYVTLKDCVLHSSGLFSVGVECSFAGPMLDGGMLAPVGWRGLGGTSYASLLTLEGDVRLYDWKPLSAVDSSTLIELTGGGAELMPFLSLDISRMLAKVCKYDAEGCGDMVAVYEGREYVHGGIAFFGGGKNYGMADTSALVGERLSEYSVNLSVLAAGEENSLDNVLYMQGTLLPFAAGEEDFRFMMYSATSGFDAAEQERALADGSAFSGLRPAQR